MVSSNKSCSVCLVVSGFFMVNGKASQARLLAVKLHEAGIPVCVIDRCDIIENSSFSSSKCAIGGSEVSSFPKEIKIFQIPVDSRRLIKQLWQVRNRYRLVCFMEETYLPVCFVALKLLRRKIAVRFATRYQPETFVPRYKNAWYLVNYFIAVSEALKQDLKRVPGIGDKITVITNRIDQKAIRELDNEKKNSLRKNLGLNPSGKFVIFVGRIQNSKGIDILLDAWKLIKEQAAETHLLILGPLCSLCQSNVASEEGENSLHDKMEIFTNKFSSLIQFHEKITYLGIKSNVSDYLAASDIFVFPSRTEGNPNAPMEAMAAGLPVITFKEIIGDLLRDGHEGILVKYEDSKALAEATICLLKDDKKRHLMGREARLRFKSKLVFDNRQTERFVRLFSG